jgi:hypothetical protein
MKVKNTGKTQDETNYKAFSVIIEDTSRGLKVRQVFGSKSLNQKVDNWSKLNSRYFARALKSNTLVTK